MELRLRPLSDSDEQAAIAAQKAMEPDNFPFLLAYDPAKTWTEYVQLLVDCVDGKNLPNNWVPSSFFVAEVDNTIVGRCSIRHQLNEYLATASGHIGYAVLPTFRRYWFD